MAEKRITIAQPTFLGWAGWFDIVDQADCVILLDDVSFSKQSWQQRNRIRTPEGLGYLTVPVRSAGRLGQLILDTELAGTEFVEKVTRTVSHNYSRAAHFGRLFPEFCEVLARGAASGKLCDLNCALIDWILSQLDVRTPAIRASKLGVGGKRGAHVARLCEAMGASRYLSPAGAEQYLTEDQAEFLERSVSVELHVYEHPVYTQCFDPFVPFASVLDLLLNEGAEAAAIFRSGRRPSRPLRGPPEV
jgi:hypothetical protein